jgi:hypothetical protein
VNGKAVLAGIDPALAMTCPFVNPYFVGVTVCAIAVTLNTDGTTTAAITIPARVAARMCLFMLPLIPP